MKRSCGQGQLSREDGAAKGCGNSPEKGGGSNVEVSAERARSFAARMVDVLDVRASVFRIAR